MSLLDLTEGELFDAPKEIKDFFKTLPGAYLEKVPITNEAIRLANHYIEEKGVEK